MVDFSESNSDLNRGLQFRDFDLTVARDNVEVKIPGSNRFWCAADAFDTDTTFSDTLSVGELMARFGGPSEAPIPIKKDNSYSVINTTELFITNVVQASKMMRLYMSTGPVIIPNASELEVIGAIAANDVAGSDFTIANSATGTIAANPDRKELLVVTDVSLRIGLGASATKGFIIDAGAYYFNHKGLFTMFNNSGGTAAINFSEFET